MVEGSEAGGPEQGPGSKPAAAPESAGGRLRFRVDLRPEDTTIVSWKDLLREANLSNSNRPESSSGASLEVQCSLVSQPPPPVAISSSKQATENELNDMQAQAESNGLNAVIERIERMYAGNGSGDEEDLALDDVPDDDEYDTEDSFIDDTELDDYFQVDNSALKHDGFFVNRGKLEFIEPTISIDQQLKKRRHKDFNKGGGSYDRYNPHKIMKMGNKGVKASSLIQRSSTSQSYKEAMPNIHMLVQDPPAYAAEFLLKKTEDNQVTVDPSGLWNSDASRQDMDADQHRSEGLASKHHVRKWKESNLQDTSAQWSNEKILHKAPLMQRKEGSSITSKSTTLEKAIGELEKIVAEFRPPSTEAKDPDNSSQAVKRRLPPEIKQKLAKVARIAQANYGIIPKEVINYMTSIVGHLMQITKLKRNLKAMANTGLSAKQEKDDQKQKIKQEAAEMLQLWILHINQNGLQIEPHDANSDDFQEAGPEEKEALKCKYRMNSVLENIATYMTFIERLEEDSGPPVRRLYEEIVRLI